MGASEYEGETRVLRDGVREGELWEDGDTEGGEWEYLSESYMNRVYFDDEVLGVVVIRLNGRGWSKCDIIGEVDVRWWDSSCKGKSE